MIKAIVFSLLFFCLHTISEAQVEKIDTDRPDQTESAVLVPKKWLQFEMGLGKQVNNSTEKEFQHPTLLTRYGISKRFELRLNSTVQTNTDISNPALKQSNTGIIQVEAGTKIALWEERKFIPKTSILFHVAIPKLASEKFKTDKLAPSLKVAMQNNISKLIGIGYNLGAEWDGFSNDPGWIYTLSTGFNLSEKWYSYVEVYGAISKDNKPEHSLDAGFAYCVKRDFKIDLSSGFGISEEAPDWYIAVGASFRFKTGK